MSEDFPTLNGEAQGWFNAQIFVQGYGGVELAAADLKDISWSETVEVGEQRSTGGRLKARTVGQNKCEAKATWYADGYDAFITNLATIANALGRVDSSGAAQISLVGFDILIQHTPLDQSWITEKKIMGCRMLSDSGQSGEGTDAETVETGLNPTRIMRKTKSGLWVVLL